MISSFLSQWNSDNPLLLVHTSGSTGTPKPLWVEKERMRASARMTCDFLHLQPGSTALLCMPLQYIAGMMMVVRSVERQLRLVCVTPSSHPFRSLRENDFAVHDFSPHACRPSGPVPHAEDVLPFDFVAMVPSQVYETLQHPTEAALLRQSRHLLIGGGSIPPDLEAELRTFPNHVWSSYGMTETLSHIALRHVNTSGIEDDTQREIQKGYFPLPGISLSQNANGCLSINAPLLCSEQLVTHDIVKMDEDGSFRILGRSDNVVCSGGIKIQIEEVETRLLPLFGKRLMVTSRPHPKFGEALVFLTTLSPSFVRKQLQDLPSFPLYWQPKDIIHIDQLPLTGTGKPDRARAKYIAKHHSPEHTHT